MDVSIIVFFNFIWSSWNIVYTYAACSRGHIVSWIIYCWLVWCERKHCFRLEIYDRLRASEQAVGEGLYADSRYSISTESMEHQLCCKIYGDALVIEHHSANTNSLFQALHCPLAQSPSPMQLDAIL